MPDNAMTSPTDDTVRLIWNELVDSDRMCRYYGYLAHRLRRLDDLLVFATVVGAIIACASVVLRPPLWVALTGLAFAALSFALSTIRKYSAKASRSAEVFRQLGLINIEWELLWNNIWSKDDDELQSAWKKLSERQLAIVERVPNELPLSPSLARKSQSEAHDFWSEFARNCGYPPGAHVPGEYTIRYQPEPRQAKPEPVKGEGLSNNEQPDPTVRSSAGRTPDNPAGGGDVR